jgi:hypothetical protein
MSTHTIGSQATMPAPGSVSRILRIGDQCVRLIGSRTGWAPTAGWRVELLDAGGLLLAEHKLTTWARAVEVFEALAERSS